MPDAAAGMTDAQRREWDERGFFVVEDALTAREYDGLLVAAAETLGRLGGAVRNPS